VSFSGATTTKTPSLISTKSNPASGGSLHPSGINAKKHFDFSGVDAVNRWQNGMQVIRRRVWRELSLN
jgi:hypothetical protein